MMGADPRKDYVPGTPVAGAKSTAPMTNALPADEQITLDPVCEAMFSKVPLFAPGEPAPSTRRMAERLAGIYEKADPRTAGYLSERLASILQSRMTNASEVNEQFRLQFALGIQQINSARPDSALNTFSAM